MNGYRIEGNWIQLRGRIKEKWFRLTGNTAGRENSRREIIIGKVQEHYAVANDAAERCVAAWERRSESFG